MSIYIEKNEVLLQLDMNEGTVMQYTNMIHMATGQLADRSTGRLCS